MRCELWKYILRGDILFKKLNMEVLSEKCRHLNTVHMEQWESELRSQLEDELDDGLYKIEVSNMMVYTGKGGYINYLIELERYIRIKYKGDGDYNKYQESRTFN